MPDRSQGPEQLIKPLVSLLLLGGSSLALAESKNVSLFSFTLEELTQQTITGSTLTEETSATVPSAVSVYSQKTLRQLGIDTLDELMNLVPGYQSYRTSSSGSSMPYSSRGRRIGTVASDVLILIDGVRYENPNFSGTSLGESIVPLSLIDRVEFIRGPGGAIYGSNAMLGVINIVTRSGINELQASAGNFNHRQAHWFGHTRYQDWTLDSFAYWQDDRGDKYVDPNIPQSEQHYTRDPRTITHLNIKAQRGDTTLLLQHHGAEDEDFITSVAPADDFNNALYQTSSATLQQRFSWETMPSRLQLSYTHGTFNQESQLMPAGSLADISSPPSQEAVHNAYRTNHSDQIQLLWHSQPQWGTEGDWAWGAEYRHIDNGGLDYLSNYDLNALSANDLPVDFYDELTVIAATSKPTKRDIYGLYLQYQRHFHDQWHLTLGARYDHFSSIGSQVSPRLGVVYNLTSKHHLKLLYGEAFRAPHEGETQIVNTPLTLGNPELSPERVKTWDAIWVANWNRVQLTSGYFENHFEDAIAVTFDDEINIQQYQNVYQGPVKGVELEALWTPDQHWTLSSSYTHFFEQPSLSFKETDTLGSVTALFEKGAWQFSGIASYTGQRAVAAEPNTNQPSLQSYWLFHFNSNYQLSPTWTINFKVKNLSNQNYRGPSVVVTDQVQSVPARGRQWSIGVAWQL